MVRAVSMWDNVSKQKVLLSQQQFLFTNLRVNCKDSSTRNAENSEIRERKEQEGMLGEEVNKEVKTEWDQKLHFGQAVRRVLRVWVWTGMDGWNIFRVLYKKKLFLYPNPQESLQSPWVFCMCRFCPSTKKWDEHNRCIQGAEVWCKRILWPKTKRHSQVGPTWIAWTYDHAQIQTGAAIWNPRKVSLSRPYKMMIQVAGCITQRNSNSFV